MSQSATSPVSSIRQADRATTLAGGAMPPAFAPAPELPLPPPDAPALDPVVAATSIGDGALLVLAAQLLRFGTVGGLGFLWDLSTVYLLRPVIGFTAAALAAYFVAASMNWILNRLWTFRGHGSPDSLFKQWLSFLGANGLGFMLNRSVVFALAWSIPFCLAHPALALACGSLTGMGANFTLSRRLVFR